MKTKNLLIKLFLTNYFCLILILNSFAQAPNWAWAKSDASGGNLILIKN